MINKKQYYTCFSNKKRLKNIQLFIYCGSALYVTDTTKIHVIYYTLNTTKTRKTIKEYSK